jgi:hypothetical protein
MLGSVTIGGKIEFKDDADRLFEATSIVVWGALQVGSAGRPFSHDAVIRLHGSRQSPTVIVANSRFLGNKMLAVLGQLDLHGVNPEAAWVKLGATVEPGMSTMRMAVPVDWSAGDRLVITSTEYDASQYEDRIIESVSADGMVVNVTEAFAHRHFAGSINHGSGFVELQAAVGKLNRNVRVEGAQGVLDNGDGNGNDNYGVHVISMDVDLEDGGHRVGNSYVTGVEFNHCGKQNSEHACVLYKYDRAYAEGSEPQNILEGSTMSDGLNYAIVSEGSTGVVVDNNVMHRLYRSAIDVNEETVRMAVTNNLIVGVHTSPDKTDTWVQPFAGIFSESESITISNNVISGSEDGGITARPYACGSTRRIIDNEIHSTKTGVFLIATSKYSCVELTNHMVWKAAHVGILSVDQRTSVDLVNIVVSDSHIGISINYFNTPIHTALNIRNSIIMGSTDASTCDGSLTCLAPNEVDVDGTTCRSVFGTGFRRVGIALPQVTNRGKTCEQDFLNTCRPVILPERLCGMSWDREYGLPGTQHASITVQDVNFAHFNADDCGRRSVGIAPNPTQRSYNFEQFYEGIGWFNTPQNATAYFATHAKTAGECKRDCDALNMLIAHDVDGTFTATGKSNSVVLSSVNPGHADDSTRCTTYPGMGAFHCWQMPLRTATFENIDRDRGGRIIGPIKLQRQISEDSEEFDRVTYSQGPKDDGCAKRFFFGQYPFLLESDRSYRFNSSNTMPNNARIRYHSFSSSDKVLLKIYWYKDNSAVRLVRGGSEIEPLQRIPTLADAGGSYAYTENTLYLVLEGSSNPAMQTFDLRTINAIQLNLTMSITEDEFFAQRETLINTLAILLKIPANRIKVAQVHPVNVADVTAQQDVVTDASTVLDHHEHRRETDGTDGVQVQVTIVDATNSSIPTSDEAAETQVEELNAVVETIAEISTSGELLEALEEVGIVLEAVQVQPPAGNGDSVQAVSLVIAPATDDQTESIS